MTGPAELLDLTAGTVVGEYEVSRLLGKGGFGSVYAATHPLIGKQVAIKVLSLRYSADPAIVSRFIAEARAVNQIRHQHIIDIFSFGKLADGRQYYVMELLDGETLDDYRRARQRLTPVEAVHILRPIALALDAAHASGIAHRDLKPENVFVARDAKGEPFPKLLDFGLAKLFGPDLDVEHDTKSGLMMGTPHYMSPEQCRGRNVDHRTDFYALGVMTYELLTGQLPFRGADSMEIAFQQISDEPRRPSDLVPELTADLDEAVLAMLAKDPDDRPDTASEAIDLLAVAVGLPSQAPPPRPVPRSESSTVVASPATPDLRKPDGAALGATLTAEPRAAPAEPRAAPAQPPAPQAAAKGSVPPATMSLPMGQLSVVARNRARWGWAGAVAVVAVGGTIAATRLGGSEEPGRTRGAAVVPSDAEAPSLAVDAAAAPHAAAIDAAVDAAVDAAIDASTTVTIRIDNIPKGTRVLDDAGTQLRSGPGELSLPRGSRAISLRLERQGYVPLDVEVIPDADRTLSPTLVKRRLTPAEEMGGFGE